MPGFSGANNKKKKGKREKEEKKKESQFQTNKQAKLNRTKPRKITWATGATSAGAEAVAWPMGVEAVP